MARKLKKKRVTKKKVSAKRKPYTRLTKAQYAKALQDPRWQKKRLKIFERDKWKCRSCGDKKTTLHVHHIKYTRKYPWSELNKNLRTVCSNCHRKEHKK